MGRFLEIRDLVEEAEEEVRGLCLVCIGFLLYCLLFLLVVCFIAYCFCVLVVVLSVVFDCGLLFCW